MNKLILSGNLGQEPEAQYFESGKNVTRLSLAVRGYNDTTQWVKVECWGKQGESAANHLHKGSAVIVEGRGDVECWISKTTNEAQAKLVVKDARWEFAGSKKDAKDAADSGAGYTDYSADAF